MRRACEDAIQRYEIHHPIVHDPNLSLWKAIWRAGVADAGHRRAGRRDARTARRRARSGEISAGDRLAGRCGRQERRPQAGEARAEDSKRNRKAVSCFRASSRRCLARSRSGCWPIRVTTRSCCSTTAAPTSSASAAARRVSRTAMRRAATFDHPQGLIASDDAIFVADTGNHAIRRIDLASGAVTTLAGNGKRGTILADRGAGEDHIARFAVGPGEERRQSILCQCGHASDRRARSGQADGRASSRQRRGESGRRIGVQSGVRAAERTGR